MSKAKTEEITTYGVTPSGTVITDGVADELAAEAERGYDLSQANLRRAGRPSLAQGVSPRVTFRLTTAVQHQALARAQREGKTLSQLAREALEHYVKAPQNDDTPPRSD